MMNKKVVKIISFILAGLMLLTCFSVLLYVFAADVAAPVAMVQAPATGDSGMYLAAAVVGGLALVAVIVCAIMPRLKKKNAEEILAQDDANGE